MSPDILLHCPFCGSHNVGFGKCSDADADNANGEFICCDKCGASTALVFPCMDDAKPLLRERWNRRDCANPVVGLADESQAVGWLDPAEKCSNDAFSWRQTSQHTLALGRVASAALNKAADVFAERQRQVSAEKWTPTHDDEHTCGDLAVAAACYALRATADGAHPDEPYRKRFGDAAGELWPWDREWWKPASPRRMLEKAAALLLAEIERLDRVPKWAACADCASPDVCRDQVRGCDLQEMAR